MTWSDLRDRKVISDTALLNTVDRYATKIYDSQELNFTRWKIRNEWVHWMDGRSETYQGDVDIVKDYITDRIKWIDNKLDYGTGISNPQEKILWRASPGYIHISDVHEPALVEIFSITGQTLYRQTVAGDLSFPVPEGIYILRISGRNNVVKVLKCRVLGTV
jgi:hypothetical protein